MANNVVTLRISDEVKGKLQKVFGEDITISDMIRNTINSYLNEIEKVEKNIINFEIPLSCVSNEELKSFYKDVCELESKIINEVVSMGYDFDMEYIKAIQRTKNSLIAHMSINKGSEYAKKDLMQLDELANKLEK